MIVELFIERGANIDVVNQYGDTPLIVILSSSRAPIDGKSLS